MKRPSLGKRVVDCRKHSSMLCGSEACKGEGGDGEVTWDEVPSHFALLPFPFIKAFIKAVEWL